MILILNVCKEKLHYFEFVKPIEDILVKNEAKFVTKHYSKINSLDVDKAEKIIICGTSLADNKFMEDIEEFSWLKNVEKPVLGICAGMQIILSLFLRHKVGSPPSPTHHPLKKKTEIGFYKEKFVKSFLTLKGETQQELGKLVHVTEVYHLHNYYVSLPSEFYSFTKDGIPQAVKHKEKEIYGVLFHPEVRNKELIESFVE